MIGFKKFQFSHASLCPNWNWWNRIVVVVVVVAVVVVVVVVVVEGGTQGCDVRLVPQVPGEVPGGV